jgi:hypothetical protein
LLVLDHLLVHFHSFLDLLVTHRVGKVLVILFGVVLLRDNSKDRKHRTQWRVTNLTGSKHLTHTVCTWRRLTVAFFKAPLAAFFIVFFCASEISGAV